jgi:hypothetical protein
VYLRAFLRPDDRPYQQSSKAEDDRERCANIAHRGKMAFIMSIVWCVFIASLVASTSLGNWINATSDRRAVATLAGVIGALLLWYSWDKALDHCRDCFPGSAKAQRFWWRILSFTGILSSIAYWWRIERTS